MRNFILLACGAMLLAGCAGDTGPQDIRLERGAEPAPAPAPGPHQLSNAERGIIGNAVSGAAPGAGISKVAAMRGDNGVVSVCGTTNAGAPFIGILTESTGKAGFSLSGMGTTEPESRAIRKICTERKLTI